jgi:hypothetical protein
MRRKEPKKNKGDKAQKESARKTQEQKKPKEYLSSLGIPITLITLGVGVLINERHLLGIALLYGGFIWLVFDAYLKVVKYYANIVKISYIMCAFSFAMVSYFLVFILAPVEIKYDSSVRTYGEGSKISGIEWKPIYTETNFFIRNNSDNRNRYNFSNKMR